MTSAKVHADSERLRRDLGAAQALEIELDLRPKQRRVDRRRVVHNRDGRNFVVVHEHRAAPAVLDLADGAALLVLELGLAEHRAAVDEGAVGDGLDREVVRRREGRFCTGSILQADDLVRVVVERDFERDLIFGSPLETAAGFAAGALSLPEVQAGGELVLDVVGVEVDVALAEAVEQICFLLAAVAGHFEREVGEASSDVLVLLKEEDGFDNDSEF